MSDNTRKEIYFIRHAKERDYTVLDNTFLKDKELSWKAKGLFAYILSLPDDWKIYLTELQEHATDGETSVRTAVQELIDLGYLIATRERNSQGLWAGYSYEVIENPRWPGKRDTVKRDTVNPVLLNTKEQNTKKTKEIQKQGLDVLPTKQVKKSTDIVVMKSMITEFTDNDDVRDNLVQYFKLRLAKGLQSNQWRIILDDLRTYAGSDAELAIELIKGAIAGGYMQIVAPWLKGTVAKRKPSFDNTANHNIQPAAITMSEEEFKQDLAVDEQGQPITF